ncbi:MAG: DUF4124 domain-containing protein [Polaromonas sp.]|nr:DUF4124 domain-containing protein [Polaromonas sp.]
MDFKPASKNLLLAIAGGSFALTAFAQWQWIDKDGRKVFSDRSPPAEIQDKYILRRPSGNARLVVETPAAAASAVTKPANAASAAMAKASAPKLSGKDAELEAKKKLAEQQDAAKKKTEEEKAAKAKAENCERAKTGLATLQSGTRMATANANGEREILDDAKRAAESKRVQEIIDSSCK